MRDDNHNSGNGFTLGMIIGGAIVFLLGTDKGRSILKSLTDEGISGLSDILEEAGDEGEDYEQESASVVKKSRVVEEVRTAPETHGHSATTAKRRFFRRGKA